MTCKTEADLHDEYAKVIRMCVGTKVDPRDCVKCTRGTKPVAWSFTATPASYTFALAIVEDRPVFAGDALYDKAGIKYPASRWMGWNYEWSWNPPKKKTFMLNGEELPLPDGGKDKRGFTLCPEQVWSSIDDAAKVQTAINKLLSGE